MMGRQFKAQMWTKVDKDDFNKLSTRLLIASVGVPMNLLALQYFPASVVRAGMSLQPIFAGVLAWFILQEAMMIRDLISIIISLTAVYLIMAVQVKKDLVIIQAGSGESNFWFSLAMLGVFIQPLLQATSRIQVKQIKSMTPKAMSCYLALCLVGMSLIGMLLIAQPGERWG
jgi:drug/metabolite transporter (DMT)-like permease